jgi:hypothetical protein
MPDRAQTMPADCSSVPCRLATVHSSLLPMGELHDDPELLGIRPRTPVNAQPERADASPAGEGRPPVQASFLELQRLAGNASVSRLVAREAADDEAEGAGQSPVLDVVGKGGGEPLTPDVRGEMEARLGADFGDVRVHRDANASESARAVDANAYTVGQDVVFRSDRWDPSSTEGKKTLAHELTHVVQQASGPVAGTRAPGGINVSSPDDEFERAADRTADAAMSAPVPTSDGPAAAGPSAQLQAADQEELLEEEETAQGDWVQRQAGITEEEPEEEEEEETAQGDWVQRQDEEEEVEEEELPTGM